MKTFKRILLGASQLILLMLLCYYSPNLIFAIIGALIVAFFWAIFDKMIVTGRHTAEDSEVSGKSDTAAEDIPDENL